jgi:hypothetical protein
VVCHDEAPHCPQMAGLDVAKEGQVICQHLGGNADVENALALGDEGSHLVA